VKRNAMRAVVIATVSLLVFAAPAAAWEHDFQVNQEICDTGFNVTYYTIISDGAGGCYITWVDDRAAGFRRVYGQHLDAGGVPLWADDGLTLVQPTSDVFSPVTTLGDDGSLWIACSEDISFNSRVYVQNVTSDGTRRFGSFGIPATLGVSGGDQQNPRILADGQGGVIVAWSDSRDNATTEQDIWAQRIDSGGSLLWALAGVPVSQAPDVQADLRLVLSEPGVALCFWRDRRDYASNGYDIYGQRLELDGSQGWYTDGRAIVTLSADQYLHDVVSDGFGGAVLAVVDNRNQATTGSDIYLHRIHPQFGDIWWSNIPVCEADDSQSQPKLAPDGDGGAYVIWYDYRPDSVSGVSIYGQYVRGNGQPAWTTDGILMFSRDGSCELGDRPLLVGDDGDLFVTAANSGLTVVQKVNEYGSKLFSYQGVVISSYAAYANNPAICSDGRGGVIAIWGDVRAGYIQSVYAQRVDRWGLGGAPEPALVSVQDRPNDQGGEVILTWDASPLDSFADPYVDRYTAWMRLPDAPPLTAVPEAEVATAAAASGLNPEAVRSLLLSGWALAGSQDANRLASYALHVPTYGDSTEAGTPQTVYRILAHDDSYLAMWPSAELTGWSVDNLAPGAPLALNADLTGVDVALSWAPSGHLDEDLAVYHVHRSAVPGFSPSPATYVGAAADTVFTDPAPPAGLQYYVVTAVDVHGNEGAPSNEVSVNSVTAVGSAPAVFALRGANPNPFNPTTAIRLDMPRDGRVTVAVYDARGARVRTLHDGPMAAGEQVLSWRGRDDGGRAVPSGVYFAHASSGKETASLKLVLTR